MLRFFAALAVLSAFFVSAPASAAPPPPEAYGRLPAIERVSLSPSGDRYAFIAVLGENRELVVATVEGTKVLYQMPAGAAKVVRVEWAGEDHVLVTVSATSSLGPDFTLLKTELDTVLVINVSTQKAFVVFSDASNVAHFVEGSFGTAQINGHWYGFFGGVTYKTSAIGNGYYLDHGWPDLYRVDLDSAAIGKISDGGAGVASWLVGPHGEVAARVMADEHTGAWSVLTGASGGRVLASGSDKLDIVDEIGWGRSLDTALIREPSSDGAIYQELALSGAPAANTAGAERFAGRFADPTTRLWIGTLAQGDQPQPTFFDPAFEARARGALKAFPGEWTALASHAEDFNRMVVMTSGAGDSGTYWLVDVKTGAADPIGSLYPDVKPENVGTLKMLDWKAADGLALHGVLSLPPGREPKNLPVVVMPHGGPGDRDYPMFDWWAQVFASHGYAVFQPNFRGSNGYGPDFHDAGYGELGRKMQTDISDGVAALAQQGVIDPKRACIVGGSYGGYAAEAGVTLQHGLYRCAVSVAGVSDMTAQLSYDQDKYGVDSQDMRYWRKLSGDASMMGSEVRAISPAKQADKADAPVLLIHGKEDTVVPVSQSQEMAAALQSAGKTVEMVTLPGGDHQFSREDTRVAMAKDSLEFVMKYNPPDPEPVAAAH